MEPEKKEIDNFAVFMKLGIVILSIIAIVGYGIKVLPNAVTVSNHGSKRELPIYCVDTEEKKVAISFNCTWENDYTESLLKILDKQGVKATFFMTGEWVDEYPQYVKAIAAAGHDIGNQSEKYELLSQLTEEQCIDELMSVHDKVKELTGVEMNLFRPPFGDYSNTLIRTAKDCGYYTIQWDVDSLDWKDYGADSIVKDIVNNKSLGNGSIILMHNGAKDTAEALVSVINELQGKGYEIVPISELIYKGQYTVDKTGRQFMK